MSDLIETLLTESELRDDAALRELLGELEREATSVRPMPSPALAELMSAPDAVRAGRRPSLRARGAVITGVVVIGVLGLGAGAAAASPEARSAIAAGVASIAHLFEPATTAPPVRTDGATHAPKNAASPDPVQTVAHAPSDDTSHQSANSDDGSQNGQGSDSNSASSGHSDDSNSGETNGDGGDGGNGGNQSGHGGSKGQGNGGPAPTP